MVGEAVIWSFFGLGLVLTFIFSGMEAGVFALSRLRIRQQMRSGRRSAKVLHEYLEHPESFLWTILDGNTIVSLLILGWLVVVLHSSVGQSRLVFAVVYCLVVFLFYGCFDLLPKMLFRVERRLASARSLQVSTMRDPGAAGSGVLKLPPPAPAAASSADPH